MSAFGSSSAGPPDGSRRSSSISVQTLSSARCLELLEQCGVGRIAWAAASGPQLFPVSYAWLQDQVMFRTSPYGVTSELVRPADVIFETDQLDERWRTGWSVLVRGRTAGLASTDLDQLWMSDRSIPWAQGSRRLIIGIAPREITGRYFAPTREGE